MFGMMMDQPLLISSLIEFADRWHPKTEIVTQTVEGPLHRYTYRDAHQRGGSSRPRTRCQVYFVGRISACPV